MTFLLKVVIFRFHVCFRGGVYQTSLFQKISHPPKSFIRSASLAEWILFKTSFSLDSPIHHSTPRSLRMLAPEKTMLGRTLSFPFWRFGQFSGANCYSLRGGGVALNNGPHDKNCMALRPWPQFHFCQGPFCLGFPGRGWKQREEDGNPRVFSQQP